MKSCKENVNRKEVAKNQALRNSTFRFQGDEEKPIKRMRLRRQKNGKKIENMPCILTGSKVKGVCPRMGSNHCVRYGTANRMRKDLITQTY